MSQLRDDFIAALQLKGRSEKTINGYLSVMKLVTRHVKKSPLDFTQDDIKNYLLFEMTERKINPSTIAHRVGALKTFYKLMLPESNLMKTISAPRFKRRLPSVLSKAEVQKVIDATTSVRSRALVMLLYSAGLRLNECAQLKIIHIEYDQKRIRVENGKGQLDRYTILSEKASDVLKDYLRYLRSTEYVFLGRSGRHLSKRMIEKIVSQAAKKACPGKRVFPHTLRHCFGVSFHSLTCHSSPRSRRSLTGNPETTWT